MAHLLILDRWSRDAAYKTPGLSGQQNPSRKISALLISFFLILSSTVPSPAQWKLEKLVLDTASGPHELAVEVMRTEAEMEKGLMFRKSMAENHGMLFDFKTEKPVMMWMKNTYLPLDMIFISKTGRVSSIVENAEPLSEKIISSDGPVYSVLEVNAGVAAKVGVKIGDRVEHPLFGP